MDLTQFDSHSGNDRRRFQRRALLDRRRQFRADERRMEIDRREAVREAEDYWNRELFEEPEVNNSQLNNKIKNRWTNRF